MALYSYSTEALDLALACRKALSAWDLSSLDEPIARAETVVHFHAGLREMERVKRTGVSAVPLEEETQALLVSTLRQDPLAWMPDGKVGVVVVHHSPLGYHRTAFQRASAKRAGADSSWPDLDVRMVTPHGPVALLLELKAGKGRLSDGQRALGDRVLLAGFEYRFARGLGEALRAVLNYLMEVPF